MVPAIYKLQCSACVNVNVTTRVRAKARGHVHSRRVMWLPSPLPRAWRDGADDRASGVLWLHRSLRASMHLFEEIGGQCC